MPLLSTILFFVLALVGCGQKSKTLTSLELVGEVPHVAGITHSLAIGASETFKAVGVFDDNHWEDKSTAVTWSTNLECPTEEGGGASAENYATITAEGIVTGVTPGTIFVVAILDASIGCYELTISGSPLVSIDVTPTNPSIAAGTNQQFTATGTYEDGSTADITSSVTWSTSSAAIATVSNAVATKGRAAGLAAGVATITATSGSLSGNTDLTVTNATLLSIAVTPTNPSVPLGLTKQFTATGTYSNGTTQDLTNAVVWNSSDATKATIDGGGLATTVAVGATTITATSGALSGTSTLTVTAVALLSLAITPANPSIALGLNKQFTATGTYSDGSTQDLTTTVVWASVDTSVATISNAGGSNGLAHSVAVGTTVISAASGSIAITTTLTVTDASLLSITVTPAGPSVAKGFSQQFTATGTYTDGSTQEITTAVTWTSSDATIAAISNAMGSKGLASTLLVGATTITATSGAVSGNTVLTVTAATLQSIAVAPSSSTIKKTQTRQYTATGTYSDGSTADITATVTWASSTNSTATISNAGGSQGLATGVNIGFVTFTATKTGVQGSVNATVIP